MPGSAANRCIKTNEAFFKFSNVLPVSLISISKPGGPGLGVVIWSLRYSAFTLTAVFGLFVIAVSLIYFGLLSFNFFPSPEGRNIYANVQFAAGTPPSDVKAFSQELIRAANAAESKLTNGKSNIITTAIRTEFQTAKIGPNPVERGEQYAKFLYGTLLFQRT